MTGTEFSSRTAGGVRSPLVPGRPKPGYAYPFIPLTDVIEMLHLIKAQGGRYTFERLAAALRQSKSSGAFRGRTAAGRMYGTVETVGNQLVLTKLGERICSPASAAEALAEAFLRVPLYEALYARYSPGGGMLPNDSEVEKDMMDLGVPEARVKMVRRVFMRSAETAGYVGSDRDRLVRPGMEAGNITGNASADVASAPEAKEPPAVPHGETVPIAEHPLIKMLVAGLPPAGTKLPEGQLRRWLAAAESGLKLIYDVTPEDPAPSANGYSASGVAVGHPK